MDYHAEVERLLAKRHAQFTDKASLHTLPSDVSQTYRISGHLSAADIAIVDLDSYGLAEAIAETRYTAVQVVRAYIKSATIAQQTTNCLAWFDPALALAQASELDEYQRIHGRVRGRLHGVPISVKDFVKVQGMPFSRSMVRTADVQAHDDAQIVAILREEGAVFLCKTTMPQTVMHLETESYLGVTVNPFNTELTSGGSSGGESALIASHGSPMGIGTDIGGSIRVPASFCGLWGFKPSAARFPKKGQLGVMPGADGVAGAIGPIARSLRDIILFSEVVMSAQPWEKDVTMSYLPWKSTVARGEVKWSGEGGKRLRIGYYLDNGEVLPVAPVRRVFEESIRALAKHPAIELVEIMPRFAAESLALILFYMDGGRKMLAALGDEPRHSLTEHNLTFAKDLSMHEMWDLCSRRDTMRQEYADYVSSLDIDVILTVSAPCPAFRHRTAKYWGYTAIWNLLDWPAMAIPTGKRVQADDEEHASCPARNTDEKDIWDLYAPGNYSNAPVGLQLSAPKWEDERLIAASRIVGEALGVE